MSKVQTYREKVCALVNRIIRCINAHGEDVIDDEGCSRTLVLSGKSKIQCTISCDSAKQTWVRVDEMGNTVFLGYLNADGILQPPLRSVFGLGEWIQAIRECDQGNFVIKPTLTHLPACDTLGSVLNNIKLGNKASSCVLCDDPKIKLIAEGQ